MNNLLLCSVLWLATSVAARAQLLPVPNARNPDWVQVAPKPGFRPSAPDSLPAGGRDHMPIAKPSRGEVAAMPNGLGKSLERNGDTYRYWDAARKLAYEWQGHPGSAAPDSLVTVRQQATGTTYTYRRAKPLPETRLLMPKK